MINTSILHSIYGVTRITDIQDTDILKKIFILMLAVLALAMGIWVNQLLKADFTDLQGQNHQWKNGQGKWTVVNYFAEWCAPCLREMPELNHFYQQYSDQYAMFAVSFDALDAAKLDVLADKYDIQFPIIARLQNLPWQTPPSSLPTTYILDQDGNLKKQLKGEQSAEKLRNVLLHLQGL